MIVLENIVKVFDGDRVLDGVSAKIPEGKITVILGPSGAGKTTLLRIIAGLLKPDKGRVLINGRDVSDEPPWRRRVSMVFQQPALLPHLNAWDNIAFGLEAMELSKKEIRERVLWASKLLHVDHLLERFPDQLSGGEQQRIALARALVTKPRILLLDEPLSNLDLALREELRLELRRVQRETGITFIHVTHDQDEALELADYLILLFKGRIVEEGDPLSVYEKPRTLEAGKFFGHNIIEVKEVDGKIVYPWDREWGKVNGFLRKIIVPPHMVTLTHGNQCIAEDVLYRRNYCLILLECNGVRVKASIPLLEAKNFRKGSRVNVVIGNVQ